jgi:hypothetical protein
MMEKIRELIWYAAVLVLFIVLYNVASRYRLAIVDQHFNMMAPAIKSGGFYGLDCGEDARRAPAPDSIIAFSVVDERDSAKTKRVFGRVVAIPGTTVTALNDRVLVDGTEVANAASELAVLRTGLLVPRNTVLVVFDAEGTGRHGLPLSRRLVPFRDIIGRVMGQ